MRQPARAAALLVAAAAVVAGCGGSGSGSQGPTKLTVYVSAPLHGDRAGPGRAIVNGAKLALSNGGGRVGAVQVKGVYLDDSRGGQWSIVRTAANARRAAEDGTAIGYIGDLDSGATRISLPITNQAEMVQISPGSTAVDLTRQAPGGLGPGRYQPSGRQTFARVVPDDDVQARAAALWAKRNRGSRFILLSDESEFGTITDEAFREAAGRAGMSLVFSAEPTAMEGGIRAPANNTPHANVVYFGGSPGKDANTLPTIAAELPQALAYGSDALLQPAYMSGLGAQASQFRLTSSFTDPTQLPPQGQRFVKQYTQLFHQSPDPAAAYGYESMALLLDAIKRAGSSGSDRGAVIDAVLSTHDRRSILGTYSINGYGDTTLRSISGYRVVSGRPVFDTELTAPR